MGIYGHKLTIAGLPVVPWDPEQPPTEAPKALRVFIDYGDQDAGLEWGMIFAQLLETDLPEQLEGLVVGTWDCYNGVTSAPVIEQLVSQRARFPKLRALMIGDIVQEEQEISWIEQSDVSALWAAFPDLEHVQLRGGNGLEIGIIQSAKLKTLIIESGGLPVRVVRAALAARTPALEHLELWLGDEFYGADTSVADLEPLFASCPFPALKTLALRDSQIADEIAAAIAEAPILDQIETLDLSLGTLSDAGAAALAASSKVPALKMLNLSHHYISEGMQSVLRKLPLEVDLSDAQDADEEDRYVAVSE